MDLVLTVKQIKGQNTEPAAQASGRRQNTGDRMKGQHGLAALMPYYNAGFSFRSSRP